MKPPQRHPLPDVLRALALLGVLVVNAAGYGAAPTGSVLGRAVPQEGPWAWAALATQGLQALLLQGKAYPALAFLFGWSLMQAAKSRSREAVGRAQLRQWRLLQLGLLHGIVLYFGDILTMYALCGFVVLKAVHLRWPVLRKRIQQTAAIALATILAITLAGAMLPLQVGDEPGFLSVQSWGEFFYMNASAFAWTALPSIVVTAPVIILCMLAGLAAARLRLLTHPRWRPWRQKLVSRWLLPLLLWNLWYALALVVTANQPDESALWLDGATPLFGLPLSAILVLAMAEAWADGRARWAAWLAPLGQRSLTLYVAHALWCMLLFSGAGLGLRLGTVEILALSIGLWLVAALAAAHSSIRWPLEVWVGRRA